jgi:hypothetical protein
MSEVNETNIEHSDIKIEHGDIKIEHSDVIAIKLEEIKEPSPIKQEITVNTNDDDIIDPVKTENKIELKPENVLIDGVEHLYSYMKSVHHEKITAVNIVVIATELMQIVEKYKGLNGPQKKMLVINVIKKIVNSQIDSQETRSALITIIDFTLPIVIDNLVSAINGNIKFDKEKVKSFFKKYFCCCISKS